MKKFFSLVLALVMVLSLTTVAWGATVEVNDYTTFTGAIADGNEIKLTADIEVTTGFTIPANTTVTIDLNGFKLYAGDASHTFTAAFTMITNKGTLTIKDGSTAKTGKIELAGEIHDANYATYGFPTIAINAITNGGTLTLESGTISVTADKDATTPKVATYAVDNNSGTGNAILNINGGALINEHNVAIRQFCNSTTYKNEVNITAGEVTGTRAVWIQLPSSNSALEQKATLNVEGGTLTATGTSDGYNLAVYSYSYGASSTATEINISGGTFEGDVAIGGGAKNGSETMNITGGTFEGAVYTYNTDTTETAGKLEISGGTFAVAPDDALLADGMQLLANGTVVTTPAAGATDPVLYVADNSAAGWATYYIATGADLDDLKQGADENCLPCYLIDGEYFTEVSPAIATYKLVYGAKTVYLNPVDSTDVVYDDEAKVFTNVTKKTDECGKLVITDTTKTYYVAYDELDDDEDYYFVATKNGSIQLLVNGKIVDVELHTVQALTAHKWVGYDVANNAYTSIKCENCEKVAKLYANKTAAGKHAVYVDNFGWITAADAVLPGTVVTPSTDKVESAETFDAGIAMYVGMSVMAAAGSAVVLKKRED